MRTLLVTACCSVGAGRGEGAGERPARGVPPAVPGGGAEAAVGAGGARGSPEGGAREVGAVAEREEERQGEEERREEEEIGSGFLRVPANCYGAALQQQSPIPLL